MMKHIALCALSIASLFIVSACLGGGGSSRSASAKPGWVMNPKKSDQYLYGVGSSENGDRESAKDEAQRDLVSQIRVGVSAVRTQNILSTRTETKNTMVARLDMQVDDVIQTTVNITDLPGIEVEQQRDMAGVTYILCRMDRAAWARSIRLKVNDLDGKISSAHDTVKNLMGEKLNVLQQAMRLYKELMPLFSKRKMLEERYSLASLNGMLPSPPVDPVEIRARLATLLSDITVALPTDAAIQPLVPQIIEACAQRGLRVVSDRAQAMLILDFKVTETSRIINGMIKLRGTASGSVIERANGRHLGGVDISGSGSSADKVEARRRMMQSLSRQIATALEKQLFTYLTRL